MKKITIIGAGNMGSAIAESLNDTDYKLIITAATETTLKRISTICPDATVTTDNKEAVKDADIVILTIKPYIADSVMKEIAGSLKKGSVIISVIAALPITDIESKLEASPKELQVIRVIPNTAIRYGKSATFISSSSSVSKEFLDEVVDIFNRSGKAFVIPEKDMAACTALASCGIAYFLRFIRAAAEGSVQLGLRPGFATEVAAITAEGAAALIKDGGHPEVEIDKVTTPGGLTIKGLNAMEEKGFTAAVIAGLKASV